MNKQNFIHRKLEGNENQEEISKVEEKKEATNTKNKTEKKLEKKKEKK